MFRQFATLAQLEVQLTCNQLVGSSNLSDGTSVRSRTLNFGFGDQCVPFYTTEILASGRGLEPLNVGVKVPCAYQFHHPDI